MAAIPAGSSTWAEDSGSLSRSMTGGSDRPTANAGRDDLWPRAMGGACDANRMSIRVRGPF